MTYSLIAIVVLLAANAFFVAAEFALVKVRGFQLEQAAADGSGAARLSVKMHKNMDAYLAACQLGITMASLGLGWVGEPAVAALLEPLLSSVGVEGKALHTISFIVGFLIFSSLHIVIGEQVPKTYAIRRPEPVTLYLAYPLEVFYRLAYPLNRLLEGANSMILRSLGIRGSSHHEVITEDEISAIVNDSEAHGEIEEKTADIIRKAFLFDDQVVKEVMVPWVDVDHLNLSNSSEINNQIILSTMHSRFPVLDAEDQVIGILNTKDLTAALLRGEKDFWSDINEHLRDAMFVPASVLITGLLEKMRSQRIHIAIVIDEYGSNIGVISLEDMLEEIVGEIDDEWDPDPDVERSMIEKTENGWNVSGKLSLPEIEQVIGEIIENSENFSTLGGMMMERLERIPSIGDHFIESGYEFRVKRMAGKRVTRVLISKPVEPEEDIDG
jgi:CBS domain containing-hemolysin-like protein